MTDDQRSDEITEEHDALDDHDEGSVEDIVTVTPRAPIQCQMCSGSIGPQQNGYCSDECRQEGGNYDRWIKREARVNFEDDVIQALMNGERPRQFSVAALKAEEAFVRSTTTWSKGKKDRAPK